MRRDGGTPRMGRSKSACVTFAVAVLALVGVWTSPGPGVAAAQPSDYRVEQAQGLAQSVEYRRLASDEGPVVAHVVIVRRDSSVRLRAILSNERVGGPPPLNERTSDMCQRVGCIAAINGDFSLPSSGEPVGGITHLGRALRSPVPTHQQISVSSLGELSAGAIGWSGRLVLADLSSVELRSLNRPPRRDEVVLYTPDYGPATAPMPSGAAIVLRTVEIQLPLGLGRAGLFSPVGLREGGGEVPIPSDGAVIAAQDAGAGTLRAVWAKASQHLLGAGGVVRLESAPPVEETLGGNPILLQGGQVTVVDDGSDFTSSRHPRTVVGWNERETFLVAVDGRHPRYSIGLTLLEAAELLARLGATDALNLDGGGSTTLVLGGRVVNRPSDRLVRTNGRERIVTHPADDDVVVGFVERPVADALVVMSPPAIPIVGDLLAPVLARPGPGAAAIDTQRDPASVSPR